MKHVKNAGLYAVLIAGAVVSLLPFVTIIFISLKPARGLFATPMWFPPLAPTLENYISLFSGTEFARYFGVTIVVMLLSTAGQVIFSTLAAYAFARMEFWGRDIIFWAFLSTLMVPNVVTLIPLFLVAKELGLVNTILGVAGPYILGTPFGIFLARQFFLGIPSEILDAGRLDGANELKLFWRIVVPMSQPVLVTLTIIAAVLSWNNFLWPLIIGGTPNSTVLTVGIANLSGMVAPAYGPIAAAAVAVIFPILVLFIFFQRRILASIAMSGLK